MKPALKRFLVKQIQYVSLSSCSVFHPDNSMGGFIVSNLCIGGDDFARDWECNDSNLRVQSLTKDRRLSN